MRGSAAILICFVLAGFLPARAASFVTKELAEIAARHHLPMPPKEARLVLAHTGLRRGLGNQSTSRDPGVYSAAFLVEQRQAGSIVILRGAERQIQEASPRHEPLWRAFSTNHVEPILGGYAVDFSSLSTFICAVQTAARGEEATAQSLWRRFSASEYWSDAEVCEDVAEQLKNPRLLLGRCLYDHLRKGLLQEHADWRDIHQRMKILFDEFPQLKTVQGIAPDAGVVASSAQRRATRRNDLFNDLTTTVNAKPPTPDSIEALLLDWARNPKAPGRFGLFSESFQSDADASARIIVLRGATVVPDLIALLGDHRLTAREASAVMNIPARIIRVGELAADLLEEITGIGASFPESASNPAPFRAWLEKVQSQSEPEVLASSVFRREGDQIKGINGTPARILAQKYPDRLPALCEEFSKNATPNLQPFALAEAVAASRLPTDVRVKTLSDFARRGTLEQQRCVLQNLVALDGNPCAEILVPLLEKLPSDSSSQYWTCAEASFTHVVMQLDDMAIWRTYLRAAKRSAIGLRMEMMNPMDYYYIGTKNRNLRLAFLAAFLNDEAVRRTDTSEKFRGPCAGFTFHKMAVRDFAAMKIASILGLEDSPDEFWTPAQWNELRKKVKEKLATEKLPNLESSP